MTYLVANAAPLRIERVEGNRVLPTLVGPEWALALVCPWVLRDGKDVVVEWDGPSSEEIAALVSGDAIVAVELRDPMEPQDPAFIFESGRVLEIYADSDLDPWRFRIGNDIYIGPLAPVGKL